MLYGVLPLWLFSWFTTWNSFIFPVYPADSPGWLNALDQGVFNVVFTLFAGKAYAIFALLFGFTFYIQSDNLKRRGGDFGYRFLWRLCCWPGSQP